MKALFAALGAALLLGACGQKGPLYLPDEGGEVIVRPAPAAAADPAPPGQKEEEEKAKSPQSPVSK